MLTAVGLLPIAVSGADIVKLMEGAASGREMALNAPYEENDAVLYAALRNILHRKGKSTEILAIMSQASTMYLSGGSSSTANQKAKTTRVSSRHR